MTVRAAAAILAIAWCAALAHAEPPSDALLVDAPSAVTTAEPTSAELAGDEAFRAAQQRATAGDPAAIDAYEQIGNSRPITRWTDDAWAEAARLAERAGDYARARRALEAVLAISSDTQLVRRARGTLERLASITGDGQWDAIAKEHERLVTEVFGGDDPRAELTALAALVDQHPDYPRANAVRGALARGWEQEGDRALALRWYRAAAAAGTAEPGRRSHLELVRALLRADELDEAEREIAVLSGGGEGSTGTVDSAGLRAVREQLATAQRRAWVRRALWAALALLLSGALLVLRRDTGSLAAAGRRLVRPPIEVMFLVPLATLLIVVGYQGNPLVAHAVRDIAIGGLLIAWISGALLEATRARHGRVPVRRALIHAALAVAAVAALAYLALDRDRLLDLVSETWRGGVNVQ